MPRRLSVLFLILVGALAAFACSPLLAAGVASGPLAGRTADVTWGVKIPMRDGVNLNATLYRPHGQTEPLPVIFTLTPYISDTYHERGMYFARNGYVFALVDSRGRGNSEGDFVPFINEGRDGYDTVEWLARQPWSNAKVGMWGGSYSGYNQWATLGLFPPHLTTIVPVASAYPGKNMPMVNNIHNQYWIQWFLLVAGNTLNHNLSEDRTFWEENFRELYLEHLPFESLDRLAGISAPYFQEWLRHPSLDAYWQRMVLDKEQYGRIRIPILTITGEYDGAQPGALAFYFEHMQDGDPATTAKHYLVIGPWDHGRTRTALRDIGGWTFGAASMVDLNKLNKEWYDWTLKAGPKPAFLKNRVAYYVGGAEQWKYADTLSRDSAGGRVLYLHSASRSLGAAGVLSEQAPTADAPDRYTYDPLDIRPAEFEHDGVSFGWWPHHYLSITGPSLPPNVSGNGLTYESAPFAEDVEISGFPKLTAWIAIDTPDTDFQVMLYEIFSDGRSLALAVDHMRARYRKSLHDAELVKPGEINR
jgi:putative CocE/NonD family hydrolase